jgi:hypothetical protein
VRWWGVDLRAIAGEDLDFFVLVEPHDILQCGLLVREDTTSTTGAANNLEVDEVDMDWLLLG